MDDELYQRRINSLNSHLDTLSDDELEAIGQRQHEQNEKDFKELKEALKAGRCSLCGNLLSHFSKYKPCPHWLLNPKGFKKKHFPLLYELKSFHSLEAYLRWIATADAPLKNINDLVEEKNSNKVIETTIRYANLEWSFSCSENDFVGHQGSKYGSFPHYHFQMKVDGHVMINYAAFHVPFHDEDFFTFAVKNGKIKKLAYRETQAPSVQTFLDHLEPEELLAEMQRADDENDAPFNLQTMVVADEGTTISGDEIAELYKESKRTGEPIAKLARRLKNVKIVTNILPGPGIPDIAKRSERMRGKSKN